MAVRCLRRLAILPHHQAARHCSSLTPKSLYLSRVEGGELGVDGHQSAVVEHLERLHSRLKKYDPTLTFIKEFVTIYIAYECRKNTKGTTP